MDQLNLYFAQAFLNVMCYNSHPTESEKYQHRHRPFDFIHTRETGSVLDPKIFSLFVKTPQCALKVDL
jgi:hypothetical protein